jgi:hypothetical protein
MHPGFGLAVMPDRVTESFLSSWVWWMERYLPCLDRDVWLDSSSMVVQLAYEVRDLVPHGSGNLVLVYKPDSRNIISRIFDIPAHPSRQRLN